MRLSWAPAASETDPCCCCPSHDINLDVVVAGVTSCNCIANIPDFSFSFTGVNGSFSPTWNGTLQGWSDPIIGTQTYTQWTSVDGTCSGDSIENTTDIGLLIQCNGGVLTAYITTPSLTPPLAFFVLFSNVTGGAINDSLPNENTCGGPFADGTEVAIDGTVTISLP